VGIKQSRREEHKAQKHEGKFASTENRKNKKAKNASDSQSMRKTRAVPNIRKEFGEEIKKRGRPKRQQFERLDRCLQGVWRRGKKCFSPSSEISSQNPSI
jgi:hypothetical protein